MTPWGDITATGRVLLCLMDEYLIPGSEKRREAVEVYRRKFVNITGFLQELREQYMDRGRILEMMEAILERCRMRTKYGKETEQRTIEDFLLNIERSEIHDPFLYLQGLLEEAALSGSQMDLMAARLQRIPIITVHQAKGCEFDTVILAGADDFTFSRRSAEDERVFYVAITRAKERLVITSACRDDRNRVRGQCEMIRNIPETFVVNEGFAGAR